MRDLFSQFTPLTAKAWKVQLERDLKGAALEDLDWQNENGFVIHPFYTAEDQQQVYAPAFTHREWRMMVKGEEGSDAFLNEFFLRSLNGGADALMVNLTARDFSSLLNNIRLDYIESCFFASTRELTRLNNYLTKHYPEALPALRLLPVGINASSELKDWQDSASSLLKERVSAADVFVFHNQNCGAALEIALVFAILAEYAEFNEELSGQCTIRTGISADYFVQMAKLRAIRRLWEVFRTEWKLTNEPFIIAETSLTNKTISDRHNNLLRTSVEAMAAISGGCNALVVNDYEVLKGDSDALSQRMALNQQHILKEESYFDKMADSACGSFYMEHLTDALAEKALQHFKIIQEQGGYFKCLQSGMIQQRISEVAQQSNDAFLKNEVVVTGINKYRNEKEKIALSAVRLNFLKNLPIENPALRFELQNFFN